MDSPRPHHASAIFVPVATRKFFWLVVAIAVLFGGVKRFLLAAPPGFPLGEGGLFVLFSERILTSGFALPSFVTFGGYTLPFAYPPAGFYLAAAVSKITGASLFSAYYYLPISLNLLALPAFCFLAAQLTQDRVIFASAAILYALMPESFVWQITGGGLPRALAALFALLAVATALRAAPKPRMLPVLGCGLLVGAAILSHLEWGMFAAIGATLAFWTRSAFWRGAFLTAAVGLVSLLVITPWLALILSRHGFDPFVSSASASDWHVGEFVRRMLDVDLFASLLTVPAILGVIRTLRERDFLLAAWAPLILLTTPRMGLSSGLAVPTALLAAFGIKEAAELIDAFLTRLDPRWARFSAPPTASLRGFTVTVMAILVCLSIGLTTRLQWLFNSREMLIQVDRPTREAMAWIKRETEPGSRFAVISPAEEWYFDRIAEWFPFLAGRTSLTTAQGLEWAGPGVFTAKAGEIEELKKIQAAAPALLPRVVQARYCTADHVALFFPANHEVSQAFSRSSAFQIVAQNAAAALYKTRVPGEHCQSIQLKARR
jgi:hypothetical protein